MSADLCSADLTTLIAFVDTSHEGHAALADDITTLTDAWTAAEAACEFREVQGNPGPSIAATVDAIHANEEWVRTIHETLMGAPVVNGVSTVPSDQVEAAAADDGTAPQTQTVQYQQPAMVGEPVTSGLVNDPINAATGNFVHADRDIRTPGFGAVLDVVRTYNSLATDRRGLFGFGWTTLLDVAVDADGAGVDGDTAVVTFTDGARITFERRDDGSWKPDLRRRLRLTNSTTGWTLSRHHGARIWHFDTDGRLTGGEEGSARYSVAYAADAITVDEARSGRWVRYALDDELVVGVETSDGRACAYAYADDHCVAVTRGVGDVTYEVADGFLVAIFDADGVLQCRNSYDETGKVLGQVSAHGRVTEFTYGDNGSTRITDDSGGPTNILFHDSRANLQAMIGGNGAAMRASFDRYDRIVRHTDREGGVTRYEYHPDLGLDVVVRTTDPDGFFEEHDYDDAGRMIRRRDRAGHVTEFEYEDDLREPSIVRGPLGDATTTRFDERGLPVEMTDADGVTTRFAWDGDGQVARITNGAGESTTFAYDPTGQLTEVRDPLGRAASFELDDTGRVRTVVDVDGLVSHVEHSPAGRVLGMTCDGPGSFAATYDDHGDLASFTDGTGATIGMFHDRSGQLVTIAGPDDAVTSQEFDAMGQLAAVIDPAGNRAMQRYDREGRSIETTDYHGRTYRREVDVFGRTTAIIGPDGARLERSYHPNGELASTIDALGRRWEFEVDALGRLVAEIDPNGGRATYEYSAGSRLLRQVTPAGRVYEFGYDDAGRMVRMVDPDGVERVADRSVDETAAAVFDEQIARFRFDDAGRVTGWAGTAEPGADPSDDANTSRLDLGPLAMLTARGDDHPAQFEYDPRGLLQTVTDPAGVTTRLLRDVRGRLIGRVTGEQSTAVEYEASGAVAKLRDATGQTTSLFNTPAGEIRRFVVDGADIGQSFTYDVAGRLASVSGLSGDPAVTFGYDPLGQLDQAATSAGTVRVGHDIYGSITAVLGEGGADTEYERDADGVALRRIEVDGHRTDYDRTASGRLVGFTDTQAGVVALPDPGAVDVDRAGRVTVDEHGRTYAYDQAGRIAEAVTPSGRRTFAYNDLGLLATDGIDDRRRTFSYDTGGHLVALIDGDQRTEFTYDAAGRRTRQSCTDGSGVDFRWDDLGHLVGIERTLADGTSSTRRVRFSGLGRPDLVDDLAIGWDDAMTFKPVRIGDRRYLRSGMLVRLAEPDAEWFDGTFDDPWGDEPSMSSGVGLGYRGELTVDGLVFMGARVYDPCTRTFLSHDPLPPVPGENGAFASPYSYSWCDPVNFVDPSGREPITVEEFDAWKTKQETNRFERAAQAMIDDPWGTLAMVGVIAAGALMVATGVGAGIGAGILIGAATAATMGLATDNFSPRSVAIGGAFGAVTGGGIGGAAMAGFGESVTSQMLVDGKGFGDIDWATAGIGAATGGLIAGGAAGAGKAFSAGAKRFRGPADDVAPTPPPRTTPPVPRGRPTTRVEYPDGVPAGAEFGNPNVPGQPRIDPMFQQARLRHDHDPDGQFDVVAHGTPDHMYITHGEQPRLAGPNRVARSIRQEPDWQGRPLRLVSCNTGAKPDGFAQQLADRLQVPVTAPNKAVWFDREGGPMEIWKPRSETRQDLNGRPFTLTEKDRSDGPGEWITFRPGPSAAPAPQPAPAPPPQPAAAPAPPPHIEPADPPPRTASPDRDPDEPPPPKRRRLG